jgi:hypothetical protein
VRATGLSDRIIRTALKELDDPDAVPSQRRSGAGRKSQATKRPGLKDALDQLIDPTTRGSSRNALRWTIKTTRRLADAWWQHSYEVSATSVRQMLFAKELRAERVFLQQSVEKGRCSVLCLASVLQLIEAELTDRLHKL